MPHAHTQAALSVTPCTAVRLYRYAACGVRRASIERAARAAPRSAVRVPAAYWVQCAAIAIAIPSVQLESWQLHALPTATAAGHDWQPAQRALLMCQPSAPVLQRHTHKQDRAQGLGEVMGTRNCGDTTTYK